MFQAELNEVLEDDVEQVARKPPPSPVPPQRSNAAPASQNAPGSTEARLQERLDMYQTAITNAKAAGETSKARRYDRGLKVGLSTHIDFLMADDDSVLEQRSSALFLVTLCPAEFRSS